MRNDSASSTFGHQDLCAVERTRRASGSREAPALVAARARLRQVAQDLHRNRQDLAALARELRTTAPAPGNSYLYSDGATLSVEEWAADCADAVAEGLVDLAKLAESFARADWRTDVADWLDVSSPGVAATRSRK